MSTEENQKPSINPSSNGPYLVKDLKNFSSKNGLIETKTTDSISHIIYQPQISQLHALCKGNAH